MSEHLFTVWKEFRFDAAHQLDAGDDGDPRYRPSPWLRRRGALGLSLKHEEE